MPVIGGDWSGPQRAGSRIAAVGLAALIAAFAAAPAAAGPGACRQIERQLAGATGEPREARRFDRAIRTQQIEFQKVQAQLANGGCSGFLGALRGHCASLQATARRMETNLAALRQGRAALRAGPDAAERARLRAAYVRSGCDGSAPARTDTREASADSRPALRETARDAAPKPEPGANGLRAAGSRPYRALCVRTCDGYFFPIAHAASTANFAGDQQRCEAACPGTEIELYYDAASGEDGAEMKSGRTGTPYSALPNAFLYKRAGYQRPPTCGCNPARGFSIVTGKAPAAGAAFAAPAATGSSVVAAKPADAGGGDAAAGSAPPSQERTSSLDAEPEPKRNVRVIGPKFLPDPDEAIDLKAPARRR